MQKVAVIGCGSIARVHGLVLAQREDLHLVAAADCIQERAEDFCECFGGTPYQSFTQLLDCEKPDVIHLCTPHSLHVPMAAEALRWGIHVLSEKPAAITPSQLNALREAVRSSPAQYGVCFQNRFNPCVTAARERLLSGKAGALKAVRAFVTWSRSEAYYTESGWRGTLSQEGGGVLTNQAIHTLDLMRYLGGEIASIEGHIANDHLPGVIEVEDTACALLRYRSGATGVFYATTAYAVDAPVLLELVCEKETLRLDGAELYRRCGNQTELLTEGSGKTPGKSYWGSGHAQLIDAFYRALTPEGEPFPIGIEQAAPVSELLFSLYAKNGIDYEKIQVDEAVNGSKRSF